MLLQCMFILALVLTKLMRVRVDDLGITARAGTVDITLVYPFIKLGVVHIRYPMYLKHCIFRMLHMH